MSHFIRDSFLCICPSKQSCGCSTMHHVDIGQELQLMFKSKLWSQGLYPWHRFWYQTGWFEYFINCWPWQKCLADKRGQRMERPIQADRTATVTLITTLYKRGWAQRHLRMPSAQHVKTWGWLATTAQVHFSQPGTGFGCYSDHRLRHRTPEAKFRFYKQKVGLELAISDK